MSEVRRIRGMLKAEFDGMGWHGDSLMKILEGVTAKQAATRPIAKGHNIWEIVLHIVVWRQITIDAVNGKKYRTHIPKKQDWPTPEATTAAAWRKTLNALKRTQRELRAQLETFPEERLTETVRGKRFAFFFILHGIIHHDLYHAGQIGILKKAAAKT